MPTIKLIASDIDGTLLQNGATRLNPAIFPMIRALRERGVLFFAASGRQATNLARLFAPVREDIGYLCENGCLSLWQGEMIHQNIMPRALGQDIARAFWETPGTEVLITGREVSYICPKEESYFTHMRDVVGNDCVRVPDILNTPGPYMKVSVYEREGLRDTAYWQRRFGERCTVVTGGREWLDTMPLGVNKGSGMRHILEHLGIAPDECLAIGDNDNDRELLEMVGLPAAVKSAKPQIRAIARVTTPSVEALLARILAGDNLSCDEQKIHRSALPHSAL